MIPPCCCKNSLHVFIFFNIHCHASHIAVTSTPAKVNAPAPAAIKAPTPLPPVAAAPAPAAPPAVAAAAPPPASSIQFLL